MHDPDRIAVRDTTVVIPFVRTPGQQYLVDVEKVREEYVVESNRRILMDRLRHAWTVEADVRSLRPRGYSMAWTYRPVTRPVPDREPRIEPATRTLENVRIVFAADTAGRPLFVLNPQWVRSRLAEAVQTELPLASPEDRPRLEAVEAETRSSEGLARAVLTDIERLYLLSGRRFVLGVEQTAQTVIRNPFGRGEIAAETSARLDSLSADGSTAYLTWTMRPDSEAIARVVLELLQGFDPGAVRMTPRQLAERFTINESGRFVIDLRTGLVEEAGFEREVRTGERVRRETTSFTTRSTLIRADATRG